MTGCSLFAIGSVWNLGMDNGGIGEGRAGHTLQLLVCPVLGAQTTLQSAWVAMCVVAVGSRAMLCFSCPASSEDRNHLVHEGTRLCLMACSYQQSIVHCLFCSLKKIGGCFSPCHPHFFSLFLSGMCSPCKR